VLDFLNIRLLTRRGRECIGIKSLAGYTSLIHIVKSFFNRVLFSWLNFTFRGLVQEIFCDLKDIQTLES
jgi:hypothetical protein